MQKDMTVILKRCDKNFVTIRCLLDCQRYIVLGCLCVLFIERDPSLKIKYSRKHPMFANSGDLHQHKKHKISAEAYTARSNELFERNLFADISRHAESGGQPAHQHGSSSKHGHHSSQHEHHHHSSHHQHEQKKQSKVIETAFL